MQCDQFDRRVQKLLDLRRAPQHDASLRQHALVCNRCATQLAATQRLLEGLTLLEIPRLDDDFAQRVVRQVRLARPVPTIRWQAWSVAVAATLLVCLAPAWWLLRDRTGTSSHGGPHRSTAAGELAYLTPATAPDATAADGDSPWTRYGHSILGLYPAETRLRHRQQVSELAEDLRPIATPFNAAVTALRRTIPVGRTTETSAPRASAVQHPGAPVV